ncbi:hypothetical protein F5879DRAFT_998623 [Lentinula edodes]|uniref:uncharacterized protein n=1 Tax=Lentinula edodes TaxID=5353 RepID=UPI001E8EC2BE|nr:uncharacterized protein C8R40DRAFT_908958 [Lentinula edodes]KAH7877637.1 hypothetical protein C8R40DRAFT_908958 [Lentinula edodes]KAJ3908521.1 hypothetical protein F5879DRAFT_998623 [Lentinula edodes]
MQIGASSQSTSYQHHHYHQQVHALASAADDQERKRRYLSFLPPPQVIEICLTFDIHIPASVKATVWPANLDEAIAALQKALDEKSTPPLNTSSSADLNPKSSDPSNASHIATEAPGPPGSSSLTSTPFGSIPHPAQRFTFANQPAYPHTPYYPQTSWSSYSQPPYGITQPYAPPPPPPIHRQPQYPEAQSSDEMPGYEDMIVEALNDVQDPEGLAPKDIYTWMVNHYRVQANFRPSASQALQKAFKRGRFEKSLSGKYRLNPNWKGGNTTRRTTRRPQSHSSTSLPPPPHQTLQHPFTGALHSTNKMPTFSQSSYMFSTPPPPSIIQTHPSQDDPAIDLGDAFEAAQHILKALNFGVDLSKVPQEAEAGSTFSPPVPNSQSITGAVTVDVANPSITGGMNSDGVRAELQVQLVLLAAQLSEMASVPSEITSASSAVLITASTSAGNEGASYGDASSQSLLATSPAPVSYSDRPNSKADTGGTLPQAAPPETPRDARSFSEAQSEVAALPPNGQIHVPTVSSSASTSTQEIIPMHDVDDSDDDDMDEVIV